MTDQWNLLYPDGSIAATESSCIKAWARINGYKPTIENLLGWEQMGYRVVPATWQGADPVAEGWLHEDGTFEHAHKPWMDDKWRPLYTTPPSPQRTKAEDYPVKETTA